MTPADIDPFDELGLVDRYLAGQATDAEAAYIAAWAKDVPERVQLLNSMQAALAEITHGVPRRETQAALQQMLAKARRRGGRRSFAVWRKGRVWGSRTLRSSLWIGATAAVISGVAVLTRSAPESSSDVTRTYATHASQQAIINLVDGTRVTLAPQTTLQLRHFGTQSRTVTLEAGEAYFEVAHASGMPFIVRSGGATATVLGTAFLVRHPTGDPHVRVAVADGKVHVTPTNQTGSSTASVTLTKGQVGDVVDSTTHVTTTDDLAPGTEWVPGYIIFHDTPFATVLQTISQWYGYHFRYADPTLGAQRVTTTVSTRSSAEALAAIEQVLIMNLTVAGDTVTLVPQPPRASRSAPRLRTYDVWTPTREVGR
jgi:transmembrane sensor